MESINASQMVALQAKVPGDKVPARRPHQQWITLHGHTASSSDLPRVGFAGSLPFYWRMKRVRTAYLFQLS